jgi:ActR/RegA family two-component response regulator
VAPWGGARHDRRRGLGRQRILVTEDDYYLASDSARALIGAGAEVIGPCPTTEDALAALQTHQPTSAIVDINLGAGPSFDVARALMERAIPVVFVTGYDCDVIPREFSHIPLLQSQWTSEKH